MVDPYLFFFLEYFLIALSSDSPISMLLEADLHWLGFGPCPGTSSLSTTLTPVVVVIILVFSEFNMAPYGLPYF